MLSRRRQEVRHQLAARTSRPCSSWSTASRTAPRPRPSRRTWRRSRAAPSSPARRRTCATGRTPTRSATPRARKVKGKFKVAPFPTFEGGGKAGILGGHNLVISAYSKNPKGAVKLIDYLTSDRGREARRGEVLARAGAQRGLRRRRRSRRRCRSPPSSSRRSTQAKARPVSPVYPQISQAIYKNVNAGPVGPDDPAGRAEEGRQPDQQGPVHVLGPRRRKTDGGRHRKRHRRPGHRRSAGSTADRAGAQPRSADGRAVADPDRGRWRLPDRLRDLAVPARVLACASRACRAGRGRSGCATTRTRFRTPEFWEAVRTTFVFTVCSVFFEMMLGLAMAMAMHSAFKGQGLLRTVVLVPWAVLTVVTAITWQTIFEPNLGFVNTVLRRAASARRDTVWLGRAAAGADGDDLRRRLEDGAVHGAAHPGGPAGHPGRRLRGGEGRRGDRVAALHEDHAAAAQAGASSWR